jgi:hypothetical protein
MLIMSANLDSNGRRILTSNLPKPAITSMPSFERKDPKGGMAGNHQFIGLIGADQNSRDVPVRNAGRVSMKLTSQAQRSPD